MQPPPQVDRLRRNSFFQGAALLIITLGVYLPAMSGGFIWDDDITLTNNPLVKLPLDEGLKHIWFSKHPTDYYPVTWSTFWIEWRLFGLHPAGYHAVNILLHAGSALLVWRILLRLGLPGGRATAWCAALLFAVHPVCVDSVAWISQRKNTLSMVFYLAAILAYLRFDETRRLACYWSAALAFLVALLSKSSVITLPLVLLCLLWFRHGAPYLGKIAAGAPLFLAMLLPSAAAVFLLPSSPVLAFLLAALAAAIAAAKRKTAFGNPLNQLLPFFVLAAAAAFMTLWFQGKVLGYGADSGDAAAETVRGAIRESFTGEKNKRDLGDRLLVSGQVYWFYVSKVLFPAKIAMVYRTWKVNPGHIAHYLPTLALAGALVLSFAYREKIGRGLCAGLTYVAVALLPVLGFIAMSYQNYSWVANHLCYVAVPGIAATATALAAFLFSRLGPSARFLAPAAFALVFAVFAAQSWVRGGLYKDSENLWRDNIAKQPGAHAGWNELGIVLIRKDRLEEALEAFENCIALDYNFGKPHNNMGTTLAYLHRYEEAARAFERALRVNPYDADAMGNLGLMYLETDQPQKALETFERTLELRLMSPATYHNMGLALEELDRVDEAGAAFARAVAMDPTNGTFHAILGRNLYRRGNHADAIASLDRALDLGVPDLNFPNTPAWILSTSTDPAVRNGPRALQLVLDVESRVPHPDLAILRSKAAALAECGRFEEALASLDAVEHLAREAGNTDVLRHVEVARSLYSSGKPFRDGPPPSAP